MGRRKYHKEKRDLAIRKKLERIRLLAESVAGDEIPSELFDDVEWMVERGLEAEVHKLDGGLREESREAIDYALREAGYRLNVFSSISFENEVKETWMVLIPFAIPFVVALKKDQLANFPTELPETVNQASERRLVRQALGLGQEPSILLDSRLYRLDHEEWIRESAVRRYLESMASYFAKLAPTFSPLARDFRKASEFRSGPGLPQSKEPSAYVLLRVICGVVIAEEGEEAARVEERLFDEPHEEDYWAEELARLINKELASHGVELEVPPSVYFQPLELWEVPGAGLALLRALEIRRGIEISRQKLLERASPGETIEPVLYVSYHGKKGIIEEVRLAAYARDLKGEEPFFTYVYDINQELETPDEVLDTISQIREELHIKRVVSVEGLLPLPD